MKKSEPGFLRWKSGFVTLGRSNGLHADGVSTSVGVHFHSHVTTSEHQDVQIRFGSV